VLRTLRHWRFTPGYLGFERVPVFYDFRFDFEIVDGEGVVRTNVPPPSR